MREALSVRAAKLEIRDARNPYLGPHFSRCREMTDNAETIRLMGLLGIPLDTIAKQREAARKAIRETQENLFLEERLRTEPEIKIGTEIFARPQGKPDRPGTVRAPGVRVQHKGPQRFKLWSEQ
jgi:hypothetical protein